MNELSPNPLTPVGAADWWRGAVIYQIYPRSFADSNADGIGDLPGITAKLDHVAGLGVDAIWVSPVYTSPMRDFGYDISDFCDIDPIYGRLADFDMLVARAHELGLKVMIDQVWSHTSDQHPWFAESRADRSNQRADWYVWEDPKPDGSPPSNWQSVFGGPAWTWDGRRGQYYLHNFLKEQPDLNHHNAAVQDAILEVARFWFDRGVDGFRIDALNYAMHDPKLTDNPPLPDNGRARTRPYDFQLKKFNQGHADLPKFIERVQALADEYDVFTLAEVGGDEADVQKKLFTAGDARLDSAYGFEFLYADKLTPEIVCNALSEWTGEADEGWPSWAFENHDAPRAVSRWADEANRIPFARMKMMLLMALRGNAILFQGEELGLTQVDIPFEKLQDPEAIANWPRTLSRDGVRTPMPWSARLNGMGFSTVEPWLPTGPDHAAMAVDIQADDEASLLNWTRQMIALRKREPALRHGGLSNCEGGTQLLSFERGIGGDRLFCVFNLSPESAACSPPNHAGTIISCNDARDGELGPYAALILRLTGDTA
ncbi:MAG: alpha-amylase family glycosyl hydrolase [Pacificimonas sp.]